MFLKTKTSGKSGISDTSLPCAFTSLGCGLSLCRLCHWDSVSCCATTTKLLGKRWGPEKVQSCKRHQSVYDKNGTIPSGRMKTHGCPWPRIRTWPTRVQQPAGSLVVSIRNPGSISSPGFWLLTDIGAGAEISSCSFARVTSHNSTGPLGTCT